VVTIIISSRSNTSEYVEAMFGSILIYTNGMSETAIYKKTHETIVLQIKSSG